MKFYICLVKNQNLLFFVFRLKLLLNFHSKNHIMFNTQNIEKLKPLYVNGFKLFILLAYPLQQDAIIFPSYPHLVAIIMYAIFHKIITKNLLFSLSIFIICFFFEPYASFLIHLCIRLGNYVQTYRYIEGKGVKIECKEISKSVQN